MVFYLGVLKQCPILLNPANGRVSFSSRSVGGVAIYSCLSGYSLVGSRTRTCQSDGSCIWSGEQPRCKNEIVIDDQNLNDIVLHNYRCIIYRYNRCAVSYSYKPY